MITAAKRFVIFLQLADTALGAPRIHRLKLEAVARAVGIRHIQPLVAEAVDTALQAVGVVIGKREGFHGVFL